METEDGSDRQSVIKREVVEDDLLKLELEPENKFDPKAIKVLSKFNNQIGYLPSELATKVKPAILNKADITVKAA